VQGPTWSGETQGGATWFSRANTGPVGAAASKSSLFGEVQVHPRQISADRSERRAGMASRPVQPSSLLKAGGVRPLAGGMEESIHR
jgi:hypothetical protein